MAKDPAFLFYTGDFSTGTQFFTDEQVGKYIRLMMAQHQHGHLSEKQMIFICKSYDEDVFSKFTKDENGLFFNERLEFEIYRRQSYVSSRSANKSGKVVKKEGKLNHKKNIRSSYDNHMENENENEIKNVNRKPDLIFPFDSQRFMETWNILKNEKKWKNKSQAALQTSLKQLSAFDEDFAIELMERAILGNYQGIVYSNTKAEYQKLKSNLNGKSTDKNGHTIIAGRVTQQAADELLAAAQLYEQRKKDANGNFGSQGDRNDGD